MFKKSFFSNTSLHINKNYFHDHSSKRKGQKNSPLDQLFDRKRNKTKHPPPNELVPLLQPNEWLSSIVIKLTSLKLVSLIGARRQRKQQQRAYYNKEQSKMSRSCIIYPHSVLSVESTQPATRRTSLGGLNRFSHESERGKGVRQKRNHKNQTENTKRGRIMAPLSSPRSYVYFHDNEIPDRPWLESRWNIFAGIHLVGGPMTVLEKRVEERRRKQGHEIIKRFWWMDRWGELGARFLDCVCFGLVMDERCEDKRD